MPSRRGTFYNVMKDFGARCNSSHDDGPAIQAAFAAAGATGGTVYFPAGGQYASPSGGVYAFFDQTFAIPVGVEVVGDGPQNTRLVDFGSGTHTMFTFANGNIHGRISGLLMQSLGHGILLNNQASYCYLSDLEISCGAGGSFWCIYSAQTNSSFSPYLSGITCRGAGNGILAAGNNWYMAQIDMQGQLVGLRVCSETHTLIGARFEVCGTGIQVGMDETGANNPCSNSSFIDVQTESCTTGMTVAQAQGCNFGPMGFTAFAGACNVPTPGGNPGIGIDLQLATGCGFKYINVNNQSSTKPAWKFGTVDGCDFVQCWATLQGGSRRATWTGVPATFGRPVQSSGNGGNTFKQCGITSTGVGPLFGINDVMAEDTVFPTLRLGSLQALDYTNTAKVGHNLRGIGVALANGINTKAIAFQKSLGGANINLTFNADTNTGGTLTAGITYYYKAAGVTAAGETGSSTEQTHTYTAPNLTGNLTINLGNLQGASFFRVYRGTASGVYDGYYETSSTTFTDTNAAFTAPGVLAPPSTVFDNDMQEPDANYGVWVSLSFNASHWWITAKATTGFTINWVTNTPDANQTLDWLIVR